MNTPSPKYSIIIPCYNIGKYLHTFLDNIPLNNDNFELIFVNDGSTDNTLFILSIFVKRNKNFTLIDIKKNKGVSNAINIGVSKMNTNWYARLDPDDIVYKNYFNEIVKYINDDTALIRYKFQILKGTKIKNPNLFRKLYFKHAWGWSLLINIKYIKKSNLYKNKFFEDLYFFGKDYRKTDKKEIYIKKYLAAYRVNRVDSITNKNSISQRKINDLKRAYNVYKNNKDIKLSIMKLLLIVKMRFDIRIMKMRYKKQNNS